MTDGRSPAVAFDNSGTLSDVEMSIQPVSDDPTYDAPVPEIPSDYPAALVGLAIADVQAFDTDTGIGDVIASENIEVHLALSNVDVTKGSVRRAVLQADGTSGRAVLSELTALDERLEEAEPARTALPVGVQLVVSLDTPRIHRIVAYTSVPRVGARRVLARLTAAGWDVHIVSGDRAPILAAVAERLGVPEHRVHPDQSPGDKADTVRSLRSRGHPSITMVGDYVNDIPAFEAADRAILIVEDNEDPLEELGKAADIIVDSLDAVPGALAPSLGH